MEQKIFLEHSNSMLSVDAPGQINIELGTKTRLLPYTETEKTLNLFNEYNAERDNSSKYRLILTVNPVCSNVLYNTRTEIVTDEGGTGDTTNLIIGSRNIKAPTAAVNNKNVDWKQGIRDTEYTHPEIWPGCVYHCGYDIFNNHMLRADEFVHVGKQKAQSSEYNTLWDYLRDESCNTIKEVTSSTGNTEKERHIYQVDNILSMEDAFMAKCVEKDGWYGFTNPGNIAIDNGLTGSPKNINKLMNNNKACEFIDLYPDRSLFSIIPKRNKYRKRLEYNWDYAISYPFKSDTDKFNEIMGLTYGAGVSNKVGAVKLLKCEPQGDYVKMTSMLRHTLNANDYVTLFYFAHGSLKRAPKKVRVTSVGDSQGHDKDRVFNIRLNDISFFAEVGTDGNLIIKNSRAEFRMFYKKNVSNNDCKYYFRKFKVIGGLRSNITKLSFSENIYGDRVGQIVYTDPVDIEGLRDNLGRPLTEVYFTMAKTNRGHEKWYSYTGGTNANTTIRDNSVEFSHCFGKVTSGLDLPVGQKDYNVHYLHNVDFNSIQTSYSAMTKAIYSSLTGTTARPIETDITMSQMSGNEGFYGDIVEFNPVEYTETVIENVYQRFNTAQRETTNPAYYDVLYDELVTDDYDEAGFAVTSRMINTSYKIADTAQTGSYAANIAPEGYYYNPKVRIKLRDISDTVRFADAMFLNYVTSAATFLLNQTETYTNTLGDEVPIKDEDGRITVSDLITAKIPSVKNIEKNGTVAFYDKETQDNIWGIVKSIDEETSSITIKVTPGTVDEDKSQKNGYILNYLGFNCPQYATYVMNNQIYTWRDYVKPSEETTESEMANMPFANDSFYIHKNINFFVRRQDPRNEYGLRNPDESASGSEAIDSLSIFKSKGHDTVDFTDIEYIIDALDNICY